MYCKVYYNTEMVNVNISLCEYHLEKRGEGGQAKVFNAFDSFFFFDASEKKKTATRLYLSIILFVSLVILTKYNENLLVFLIHFNYGFGYDWLRFRKLENF